MTAVLLWKEYRQQRAFWLTIAFLAILLVLSLAETLGRGSLWQVFHEESIAETLTVVLVCLSVAYGIVSGALLLAGESDDGTLVFLDQLTGLRGPLFARKVLAGVVLTLSLNVFLAGLSLALGFGSWDTALLLPLLGLDGLVWGLLAGALCRKVLTAGLTGIVFMAISWPLALLLMMVIHTALAVCGLEWMEAYANLLMVLFPKALVAGAGGYLSWRVYCRDDLTRRTASTRRQSRLWSVVPFSWRVLCWLAFRQGRWVLAAGLASALLLSGTVGLAPLLIWPISSLLLGLAFGLAVFAPDQIESQRFLGVQRFPPGLIWAVKVVFWGTALLALTALAWFVDAQFYGHDLFSRKEGSSHQSQQWAFLEDLVIGADVSPFLLVGLWPLYGFCFGQFFGQVVRRPALAVILALFLTPLVVATWVPALVFGGLQVWQVLIIPVLLLLTTRFVMWPWLSGRLLSARPLLGIAGAVALMVLSMIGCRWYRVVEVPDVGEPFDVQAFRASLPSPEQNEAGRLIRKAGAAMREQRKQIDEQLFHEGDIQATSRDPSSVLSQSVLANGWPKQDKELSRWLDRLFTGEWVQEAEKAAQLPLDMVQDPHLSVGIISQDCRQLAALFVLRALQRQAHGDPRGALHHLETVLALSRQVRNDAAVALFETGNSMEGNALFGFRLWLQNSGPDKELLRAALMLLQRHEAAVPDPANTIKAEYLAHRNDDPPFNSYTPPVKELLRMAYQVPGEKECQRRILRACVSGQLRVIQQPYWKTFGKRGSKKEKVDPHVRLAEWTGLPPKDGPGSHLSARQWGKLVEQFWMYSAWSPFHVARFIGPEQQSLHAAELATALALHQADHGKPPEQLDALVPAYLAAVPDDPRTGEPFRYRISPGETFPNIYGQQVTLAPGQAFVESADSSVFYLMPVWTRKEEKP
jgi:hypothetical protein